MRSHRTALKAYGLGVLLAAAFCFALTQPAYGAATAWEYNVTVPDQTPDFHPNDLHLIFSGSAGSIHNVAVFVNGALNGTATAGGDTIHVTWGAPLNEGDAVRVTFNTNLSDVSINVQYWTIDDVNAGAADGQVGPLVPAASPWGLIALATALICLTAYLIFRRRRTAVA
jgi:hypothetical protein